MKISCFVSLMLLVSFSLRAGDCDCGAYFASLKAKRSLFGYEQSRAQNIVNEYTRLFVHELPIVAAPHNCQGNDHDLVYATMCTEQGRSTYVIFYQESFMDKLQKNNSVGDLFVLAHEVSHHLLAHIDRARRTILKKLPKKGQEVSPGKFLKNRSIPFFRDPILAVYLEEVEADLLALWLVRQEHNLTESQVNSIYQALIDLYMTEKEKKKGAISLRVRQKILFNYQEWLKTDPKLSKDYTGKQLDELMMILSEESHYMYSLALSDMSDDELKELEESDLLYRERLLKNNFSAGLLLGGIAQFPDLVPASAGPYTNILFGTSLRYESIFKKHAVLADVTWNHTELRTYLDFGKGKQISERLTSGMLRFKPMYEYSIPWRKSNPFRKARFSAGASIVIPLNVRYRNYGIENPAIPELSYSIHPVVGFSSGIGKRKFQDIFRFGVSYEPHKLSVSSGESLLRKIHIPSLSFSAAFTFF